MSDDDPPPDYKPGDSSPGSVIPFFSKRVFCIPLESDAYSENGFGDKYIYELALEKGAVDGGMLGNLYMLHMGPLGIDTTMMIKNCAANDLERGGLKFRLGVATLGKGNHEKEIKDKFYEWRDQYIAERASGYEKMRS